MKAFLALVSREIDERKALLAAAAIASLLPLLAPLLPSTGSNPAPDIREAVMWVMVGFLVPLFALLLGVSFIGRDLTEGRMGFYFAQPISGPIIWFGKFTAVVVLVWGAQLLIMLPTAVFSPDPTGVFLASWIFDYPIDEWLAPVVLWGVPVTVVLAAHALGIVWRARSAWLVADLIAVLAVLGGAWLALSPFVPNIAPVAAFFGGLWLVPWILGGLLIGGAAQVTVGRIDIRRSHRALSLSFWPILLSAVMMVATWSWWVRSANPRDLDRVEDVAVGSGEWIAVTGQSWGRVDYHPRFLVNTANGRWMAAGTGERWYHGSSVDFSADMSRAVWAVPEGRGDWTVMAVDLDAVEPQPRSTGVVLNPRIDDLAVSADGSRFVAIQGRTVSVYDVNGGVQLVATRFDDEFIPQWAYFEDASTITIETRTSWKGIVGDPHYRTYQLDADSKLLSDDGSNRKMWRRWVVESEDGPNRRLVEVATGEDERLLLVDDATGEHLVDLGIMPDWRDVRLVGNEKIMVVRDQKDEHCLEIFDLDGRVLNRLDFEPTDEIYVGGEIVPGRFTFGLVTWGTKYMNAATYRTVVVDLASATIESTLDGYRPLLGWWGVVSSAGVDNAGTVATRLLMRQDYTLHLWHPDSGTVSPLVPGID